MRRLVTVLLPAIVAGVVSTMLLAPGSGAVTKGSPAQPFVEVRGEGAWSVSELLVAWQNELLSAKSPVKMTYLRTGSYFGRQDLTQKGVAPDFAISGIPFQPGELDGVKGGASAFISAPVQVGTLGTLVEPPNPGGNAATVEFPVIRFPCNPDDPNTWPPGSVDGSECIVRDRYKGVVKIPAKNLAAMYLNYSPVGQEPKLYAWNDPNMLEALGLNPGEGDQVGNGGADSLLRPGIAARSEPDEITYYLQQYIKRAAPDVWNGEKALTPGIAWEPITERSPRQFGITRPGAEEQVVQLGQNGCGVGGGTCAGGGGIAAVQPQMLETLRRAFPPNNQNNIDVSTTRFAAIQNAAGEWVQPTPSSIDKAVDAGGDEPLYALSHRVPGAYPLVWIDRFYAPAHGLSVEKTEGLAMLLRYLVTTGQDKEAAVGEGRLSAPLVKEALAAADAIVNSNCVGPDRHVARSTDPGPLAPESATAMRSIGTMAHCVSNGTAVGVTTATTFHAGGASSNDLSDQGSTGLPGSGTSGEKFGSSGAATTSPDGTASAARSTAEDGGTSTPGDATGTSRSALLTASKLPLGMPASHSGTDRLATFMLGVGLYLLLRKPCARLFRRLVP